MDGLLHCIVSAWTTTCSRYRAYIYVWHGLDEIGGEAVHFLMKHFQERLLYELDWIELAHYIIVIVIEISIIGTSDSSEAEAVKQASEQK